MSAVHYAEHPSTRAGATACGFYYVAMVATTNAPEVVTCKRCLKALSVAAAPREPGHAEPIPGPGAAASTPPLGSPRLPPPQVASERVNATVPPGDEPLAKSKASP